MLLSPVVLAPVAPTFGGKFSRTFHVVVFCCFGTGCRNFWWEVLPRISSCCCLLMFWHRLLQLLVGSFPAHFMLLSSHVLAPAAATFGRKFSRAFRVGAMNIYFKTHRPSRELIFLKNRVTGFIMFPPKKTVRVTNETATTISILQEDPVNFIRITGVLQGLAHGPREKSLRVSWPLYSRLYRTL